MTSPALTIGIGFEQREALGYHVLAHSILSRASIPVRIIPIKLSMLGALYTRPRDPRASNEFTYSRFLLPYLCDYEGVSVFMDSDILCRVDIAELLALNDPFAWVHVVKHDYVPKDDVKYLGNVQHAYPRKNWSSVMMFNNYLCRKLTPTYVNTASPAELHRFAWCEDRRISELPVEWNHLVGEYDPNPNAKLVHFTNGLPRWYPNCEFSAQWHAEVDHATHIESWQPTRAYGDRQHKETA